MGLARSSNAFEVPAQASPFPPLPDEGAPLETLVSEAVASPPEEASLQAQRRSAQASIKASLDTWYPAVSAVAGATGNGTALGTRDFLGLTPNANAGLVLAWLVNAGPYIPAAVRVARALLAGIEAQLDALHLQVRVDVPEAGLLNAPGATAGRGRRGKSSSPHSVPESSVPVALLRDIARPRRLRRGRHLDTCIAEAATVEELGTWRGGRRDHRCGGSTNAKTPAGVS